MLFTGKRFFVAMLYIVVLATFSSFSTQAAEKNNPTIDLAYVQGWPSSVITTALAANVIENKLHHPVKLTALSTGVMYQATSSGDVDAMLSAWLPVVQKDYYEKVWPNVLNLGPNLRGTKSGGLAVPSYVNANSIDDLKEHADKFGHRIVGIDAGAGVMQQTQEVIKAYGLDYRLQSSSTAAMAAALKRAIRKKKWIVVTAWSPLWIWERFDLKFLDDPEGIYGQGGYVATLAARELPDKAPAVYTFLRRFQITLSELNYMSTQVENGEKPRQAIRDWAQSHPKRVNSWIAGINQANP